MAKPIKIIKKSRKVMTGRQSPSNVRVNVVAPKQPEYSTAVQRIMALPAYKKILASLQKGTSVALIVSWMDKEGWMGGMTTSTATQYLYRFRTECPHLLSVVENDDANAAINYDHFVGTTMPTTDVLAELDKLIAVQRRRIAIDLKTEISIGKLLEPTHKEVIALGKLLELRSTISGGNGAAGNMTGQEGGTFRELQLNEADQDKMSLLAGSLIRELKSANKVKTKKTVQAKA